MYVFIYFGRALTTGLTASHPTLLLLKYCYLFILFFQTHVFKQGHRFKGIDLIDREPDELWTEVHGIVQETVIKTIPAEKKCKKANGCLRRPYKIAVKRREEKSKGEKKRYSHLNAEFQRIARRDNKAFLSNRCKEIEENNRMGKTRDHCKKI